MHFKLTVSANQNFNSGKNQWFMVLQDHIQALKAKENVLKKFSSLEKFRNRIPNFCPA